MRSLGHSVQLLLLQAGMLRRHRLPQPVDAEETHKKQMSGDTLPHFRRPSTGWSRSICSSLDVLLVARARHRLGPPALLLLRHIILERRHHSQVEPRPDGDVQGEQRRQSFTSKSGSVSQSSTSLSRATLTDCPAAAFHMMLLINTQQEVASSQN